MLFDIIQIPIKTYNLGQSFLLCFHIPRSLELFFISLHVKIPVLVSFISKTCVCIYICNMFSQQNELFSLLEEKYTFLRECSKATFSRFLELLGWWKNHKIYISRGRGKVFFTLCLKSDRIKESLRNVSNRSFFLPCRRKESEAKKRRQSLWVLLANCASLPEVFVHS